MVLRNRIPIERVHVGVPIWLSAQLIYVLAGG